MSTDNQLYPVAAAAPSVAAVPLNWYALLTRSRHEKVVAERLEERGFETFLPIVREVRV
jgi:hypothetical protein